MVPNNVVAVLFEIGNQVSAPLAFSFLMEEFSACITLFYLEEQGALLSPRMFNSSPPQHSGFEFFVQQHFLRG
jgi:hypothetical protein